YKYFSRSTAQVPRLAPQLSPKYSQPSHSFPLLSEPKREGTTNKTKQVLQNTPTKQKPTGKSPTIPHVLSVRPFPGIIYIIPIGIQIQYYQSLALTTHLN
ncbi:MAG: hypothetical protein ACK53Y_27860, partial [bacterium]